MKQKSVAVISVDTAMSSERIRENAKKSSEAPSTTAAPIPALRPYNRRAAA